MKAEEIEIRAVDNMISYSCSSCPWILYSIVRTIAAKLKVRAF
jgi:hypothetical protein